MKEDKPVGCGRCDIDYATVAELRQHVLDVHPEWLLA